MSRIISQCSCQTSSVLRPAVHGGHCIGRAVPRPAYQRPVRVRSASAGSSFDEDQELDYETSAELARITDPMKIQAVAKHLELMWKISQTRSPSACECCNGTGETECIWCHGTGVLTIGDEIYCTETTGCRACPICNNTGQCKCAHCRGTGKRASWMEPGCPV